jgi:radical SAM enzyme (TIGR01210 family)
VTTAIPLSITPADTILREAGQRVSRKLRRARLAHERSVAPLAGVPEEVDLFFDHAPSGTYPIVAFRTVPCDRWLKGLCTPCSYSARSYPVGIEPAALHASVMTQLEWLLQHFDEFFTLRSTGDLSGYRLRSAPQRPWYMLQLAGESSFFRDAEIPSEYRRAILERLIRFQDEANVNLHVMIECRPEHLVAAERSSELETLRPLFRALDVVVNMGYEHFDEFLRNVTFAKDLSAAAFAEAIEAAVRNDLDPGAFLFAGSYVLATSEALEQTRRSLHHLEQMGVFANVMVPNLQGYTLPDLLYELGLYDLPEPYFLLDLAELLCSFQPQRARRITPFDWFIGGLVSDPPPRYTVLDHPRRKTSSDMTAAIYDCVLELVSTLDRRSFEATARRLRRDSEYRYYAEELERTAARSWAERQCEFVRAAESYVDEYIARLATDAP